MSSQLRHYEFQTFLGVPGDAVFLFHVPDDLLVGGAGENVLGEREGAKARTVTIGGEAPVTALAVRVTHEVRHRGPYLADAPVEIAAERKKEGRLRLALGKLVAGPLVGKRLAGNPLEGTRNLFNAVAVEIEVESRMVVGRIRHHRKQPLGTADAGGEGPILVEAFGEVGTAFIDVEGVELLVLGVQPLEGQVLDSALP